MLTRRNARAPDTSMAMQMISIVMPTTADCATPSMTNPITRPIAVAARMAAAACSQFVAPRRIPSNANVPVAKNAPPRSPRTVDMPEVPWGAMKKSTAAACGMK